MKGNNVILLVLAIFCLQSNGSGKKSSGKKNRRTVGSTSTYKLQTRKNKGVAEMVTTENPSRKKPIRNTYTKEIRDDYSGAKESINDINIEYEESDESFDELSSDDLPVTASLNLNPISILKTTVSTFTRPISKICNFCYHAPFKIPIAAAATGFGLTYYYCGPPDGTVEIFCELIESSTEFLGNYVENLPTNTSNYIMDLCDLRNVPLNKEAGELICRVIYEAEPIN